MPRPRVEDRSAVLTVRLPTIQVSEREREGAAWLREQRSAELRKEGVTQTSISGVLRWLLRKELLARGFDPDAPLGSPPIAQQRTRAKRTASGTLTPPRRR